MAEAEQASSWASDPEEHLHRALSAELRARTLDAAPSLLDLSPSARDKYQAANMAAFRAARCTGAISVPFPELPKLMKDDPKCPAGLFVRGDPSCLHSPCVAVVGTRTATAYGLNVAKTLSADLVREGITVVSGGAFGIDAAAHNGALAAHGKTVAVLTSGIDTPQPAQNARLFGQIAECGCLVSQFGCGAQVRAAGQLARNRTIAALCVAVCVVEAPEQSGALHTAGDARALGRPVFVVPGPVTQSTFSGSHALLRNGARLVTGARDVLQDLGVSAALKSKGSATSNPLLGALQGIPQRPELLAEATGLTVTDVLALLTELEIDGRVIRSESGYALCL